MSTRRHFDAIALGITALAVALAVAFMHGEALGVRTVVDADSEAHSDDEPFTQNDLDGDWDTDGATTIRLEGDTATVVGRGAYVWEEGVTIASSGTYVVSGSLRDASLTVDANDNSKVWVLLDGVSIERSDDACIVVDQADKVFLTLADGTTNTLVSGEAYSEDALADGTDAVLFAHDDLTINGGGALVVSAGYRHGISANDDLVITGGDIEVQAPTDAIHANDSLRVRDATLSVTAGDDGLAVDNDGGYLYVASGTIDLSCGDEGMVAPGDVTVAGGDIRIETGTDQGHHGIKAGGTCTMKGGTLVVSACYEGIQATHIDMAGGDLTVCPADDGLNASTGDGSSGMGAPGAGGMGGQQGGAPGAGGMDGQQRGAPDAGGMGGGPRGGATDASGEDGEQTSEDAAQGDGTRPPEPPEGLGADVGDMPGAPPDGGRRETASSESGEAAPPSATRQEDAGRPVLTDDATAQAEVSADGDPTTETGQEDAPWIHVSGGSITVVNETGRDADGLDSNGDIVVSGGDIRVSLKGDGSNSALDYGSESGGSCTISGGTVVACGGSSMAEGFDSGSTQPSLLYSFESVVEAGTTLSLVDGAGATLLSYEVPCTFSSANLSCPEMCVGETYQLVVGDAVQEVTLEEAASSAGASVGAAGQDAGMPGGGMGPVGTAGQAGDDARAAPEEGQAPADAAPAGEAPDGSGPEAGMPTGERDSSEAADDAWPDEQAESGEGGYTTETLALSAGSVGVLVAGLALALWFKRP